MKIFSVLRSRVCRMATAGLLCAAGAIAVAANLPSDSIYQLGLTLEDQDGHGFQLAERQGQPILVSLFYSSCQFVCPRLVDTLIDTQRRLPEAVREQVSVLLVSIDPVRDSVAVLKGVADQRKLDLRLWTLARTDAAGVRKLAAVLGVQYRALPGGDFNHSTELILLDRDGRIVIRSGKLGSADPVLLSAIQTLVHSGAH